MLAHPPSATIARQDLMSLNSFDRAVMCRCSRWIHRTRGRPLGVFHRRFERLRRSAFQHCECRGMRGFLQRLARLYCLLSNKGQRKLRQAVRHVHADSSEQCVGTKCRLQRLSQKYVPRSCWCASWAKSAAYTRNKCTRRVRCASPRNLCARILESNKGKAAAAAVCGGGGGGRKGRGGQLADAFADCF